MNPVTLVRALCITTLLFAADSYADTLSDRTITNFIASLSELNTMEEEFEVLTEDLDHSDDAPAMPDFEHIVSSSLREVRGHPAYDKLAGVVKRYGFNTPELWAQVGDRIFRAWMAIEMDTQESGTNQEMMDALAELENNPDIPQAQKEQMKAMLGGTLLAMQQASNAPQADVNAVRPHVDALREATEGDKD